MKEFYKNKIQSEEGAETIEIIIGIVIFVIFGLTVFGLITNAAGRKAAAISNCFGDSGHILDSTTGTGDAARTDSTCTEKDKSHTYTYNGEKN